MECGEAGRRLQEMLRTLAAINPGLESTFRSSIRDAQRVEHYGRLIAGLGEAGACEAAIGGKAS